MRRWVAAALCVLLTAAGPARLAGAQAAATVQRVEVGGEVVELRKTASGDLLYAVIQGETRSVAARRFEVPRVREWDYGAARRAYGALWEEQARHVWLGGLAEPRLDGGLLSVLGMSVSHWDLVVRGFRDLFAAAGELRAGGRMENLRDPVLRYQFWRDRGIYERYTAREIAFLNSVVFPLVLVEGVAEALLGAAVAGSGAATRLGPLGGAAVGLALLAGSGAHLMRMVEQMNRGEAIEPLEMVQAIASGAAMAATGITAGTAGTTAIGVSLAARLAGVGLPASGLARVLGGIPAGILGAQVTLRASQQIAALANVWGIPVPAGEARPVASGGGGGDGSPPSRREGQDQWEMGSARLSN